VRGDGNVPHTRRRAHPATSAACARSAAPIDEIAGELIQNILMRTLDWILAGAWAAFVVTWFGAAWRNQRTVRRSIALQRTVRRSMVPGLALVVVVALLHYLLPRLPEGFLAPSRGLARGVLGCILCVIGVAYAIWARLALGSNWGLPMSQKEHPELVTAGPYARVRHPIYTGIMLALLGTAVVTGTGALVVALAFVAYFLASAFREERHLRTEFPEAFRAYQARTKRFIPYFF
jgi:protein-S-isoprenylcysteine O-methyltransferase Ste14